MSRSVRWSVALAVGIRQAEAIGLRWQFVDLDAGTIEVGWQLKRARYRHGCQDPAACAVSHHRVACPNAAPSTGTRPAAQPAAGSAGTAALA